MPITFDILTEDDAQKVAQAFIKDDIVDLQDYSLNSYSEHKLGHMGSHLQLTITIKNKNTNVVEKHKFFVKAILQSSQAEIDFMNEHGIFTEEFAFFKKIKPLLMENYNGEPWSPVCYLANKAFLVMEDLRMKEYKLATSLLDKTSHIKSALKTLAKFHACSIVAEARLSELHKEPIYLNEYYPNSFEEKFFPDSSYPTIVNNAMNVAFSLAEFFGRSRQKISKIYEKLPQLVKPSKICRNVICHGDLWANNLMFSDYSETEVQCVLVDFQTMRYAPSVLDILQFLYLNTTSNYRERYEQELLGFYSTVLETTIKNNDETKTATAPTFEEILEAYRDSRFFGASLASIYLPFILLDQKTISEMYDAPDGFSNALYSDRTEATFVYMKQNETYKNRMEEVINELADIADR